MMYTRNYEFISRVVLDCSYQEQSNVMLVQILTANNTAFAVKASLNDVNTQIIVTVENNQLKMKSIPKIF